MNTYSPKLLITGADGQVAQALAHHEAANHFRLLLCTRNYLDISNQSHVDEIIAELKPDIIINTAAYTKVDLAEKERELALITNQHGIENIARAASKKRIPIIHLSTDYVFDGEQQSAYVETDLEKPINFYGESKYLGEKALRAYSEHSVILRLSGVFSEYQTNFVKSILRLAQTKPALKVVADQTTCPTDASQIAGAIFTISEQIMQGKNAFGTYHYCSKEALTWHQFATEIVRVGQDFFAFTIDQIEKTDSKTFAAPAKRPAYAVLACDKIARTFALPQPDLQAGIHRVIQKLSRKIADA